MPPKQTPSPAGDRSTEELHVYILDAQEAAAIKSLRRRAGQPARREVSSLPVIQRLQQQMSDLALTSLMHYVTDQARGRMRLLVVNSLISRAERG